MVISSLGITQSHEYREYGHRLYIQIRVIYHDPKLDISGYKGDREWAVGRFNDNIFHDMLMKFNHAVDSKAGKDMDKNIVYLCVYSMEAGVIINTEDMKVLSRALESVQMSVVMKRQVKKALRLYENIGFGWDFESLSVANTDPGRCMTPADQRERDARQLQERLGRQDAYNEEKAVEEEERKAE